MGISSVLLYFFKAGRRDDFKARVAQLDIANVRKGCALPHRGSAALF